MVEVQETSGRGPRKWSKKGTSQAGEKEMDLPAIPWTLQVQNPEEESASIRFIESTVVTTPFTGLVPTEWANEIMRWVKAAHNEIMRVASGHALKLQYGVSPPPAMPTRSQGPRAASGGKAQRGGVNIRFRILSWAISNS